jgi:hypothetical protein
MRLTLLLVVVVGSVLVPSYAIDNFKSTLITEYCDTVYDNLDDPLPQIGNVFALMVLATCDTAAMDPAHRYQPAYAMPSWKTRMLNPDDDESLSSYFSDISYGAHHLTGNVIGQDATHVIVSPIAPRWPEMGGNGGGPAFVYDVMTRLDSVVNFNDYDGNHDGNVDYVFFGIYGNCDGSGNCPYNGRGVSAFCSSSAPLGQLVQ